MTDTPDAHAQSATRNVLGEQASQLGHEIVLENAELLVAFDSNSGALVRMVRKITSWTVERRPELGISFRLLVPMKERRDNFVPGPVTSRSTSKDMP